MKQRLTYIALILYSVSFARGFADGKDTLKWEKLIREKYILHYTSADQNIIKRIDIDLQSGLNYIVDHFHHFFPNKFDGYIFPGRSFMDKQWQKDWGDSSFQSQCWMIASGVAHRLDVLSPNTWAKKLVIIMEMTQQRCDKFYGMSLFMYFMGSIILITHSVILKN